MKESGIFRFLQRVDKLSTRCQAFEKTVIFFRFEPVGVQRYDKA